MTFINFASVLVSGLLLSRSQAQTTPKLCTSGDKNVLVKNCASQVNVSCTTKKTGELCQTYFLKSPSPPCGWLDINVKYEYCNCNSGVGESIVVYPIKTYGLYRSQVVINGSAVKELLPNTCDVIVVQKQIDTCNSFAKAELAYNGYNKKYGPDNSVCWAFDKSKWDYPQKLPTPSPTPEIKAQPTLPNPNLCKAQVSCLLENGTLCAGNVVRGKTCGFIPVTLVWKYCNEDKTSKFITSTENDQSYLRFNQVDENMDKSPIPPGQCKELSVKKFLDTCRDNNIVDMRIQGVLEGGSGWCYKEEELLIKTFTKAPTKSPTPAPTISKPTAPNTDCSAHLSCKLTGSNKSCAGNIIVGAKCGPVPVTLQYKYCNKSGNINFIPYKTSDKSYVRINGVNKFFDPLMLAPNTCKEIVVDELLDSCREKNDIDMRIEGSFQGSKDWCNADTKVSIKTLKPAPTPAPNPPIDGNLCKVSVFCTLDNGKPCLGNISRPETSCGQIPVTMFWKFCNKHTTSTFIPDISKSKTYMKIRGVELLNMNKSPLVKGTCRSLTTKEYVDTCLDVNKVEMKVEGTFDTINQLCKSQKVISILTKVEPNN